jgi:hypothetical protein
MWSYDMKRIEVYAVGILLALVPAVFGLWGNASFSRAVPVRVPDQARATGRAGHPGHAGAGGRRTRGPDRRPSAPRAGMARTTPPRMTWATTTAATVRAPSVTTVRAPAAEVAQARAAEAVRA